MLRALIFFSTIVIIYSAHTWMLKDNCPVALKNVHLFAEQDGLTQIAG